MGILLLISGAVVLLVDSANPQGWKVRAGGVLLASILWAVALFYIWLAPRSALESAAELRAALSEPDWRVAYESGFFHVTARYRPGPSFLGEPSSSAPAPEIHVDVANARAGAVERALQTEGVRMALRVDASPEAS